MNEFLGLDLQRICPTSYQALYRLPKNARNVYLMLWYTKLFLRWYEYNYSRLVKIKFNELRSSGKISSACMKSWEMFKSLAAEWKKMTASINDN